MLGKGGTEDWKVFNIDGTVWILGIIKNGQLFRLF